MVDYESVLNDAMQLTKEERKKLRNILLVDLHERGVISDERFLAALSEQMLDDFEAGSCQS